MADTQPLVYRELTPDNQWMKRAYVSCALWLLGRAIQSAARFDDTVKRKFSEFGERFSFSLEVIPSGPAMVLEKEGDRVRFAGARPQKGPPDLQMAIKHLEAAFCLLTFRESAAAANASHRFNLDGDPSHACIIVRILDRVQVLLLPAPVARLAVKSYPRLPLLTLWIARVRLYAGLLRW
jgi:hypothetical protein